METASCAISKGYSFVEIKETDFAVKLSELFIQDLEFQQL